MEGTDKKPKRARRRASVGFSIEVASLVVVAIATTITAYQAYLTRESLVNSINQERAWLRLEGFAHNGMSTMRPKQPMLDLHVKAENVGNVPAVAVRGGIVVIAAPPNPAGSREGAGQNFDPCPAGPADAGVTIFPGESVQLLAETRFPTQTQLKQMAGSSNRVALLVSMCVKYLSGARTHEQRTSATYIVQRRDKPRDAFRFDVSNEDLDEQFITLQRLGARDRAE